MNMNKYIAREIENVSPSNPKRRWSAFGTHTGIGAGIHTASERKTLLEHLSPKSARTGTGQVQLGVQTPRSTDCGAKQARPALKTLDSSKTLGSLGFSDVGDGGVRHRLPVGAPAMKTSLSPLHSTRSRLDHSGTLSPQMTNRDELSPESLKMAVASLSSTRFRDAFLADQMVFASQEIDTFQVLSELRRERGRSRKSSLSQKSLSQKSLSQKSLGNMSDLTTLHSATPSRRINAPLDNFEDPTIFSDTLPDPIDPVEDMITVYSVEVLGKQLRKIGSTVFQQDQGRKNALKQRTTSRVSRADSRTTMTSFGNRYASEDPEVLARNFLKAQLRMEFLWEELKIPYRDRDHILSRYCVEPSLENSQQILSHTKFLLAHRRNTQAVLRSIHRREKAVLELLSLCEVFRNRFALLQQQGSPMACKFGKPCSCMHHSAVLAVDNQLKEEISQQIFFCAQTSVHVLVRIREWRQLLWRPRPFLWKGTNYPEKMLWDLQMLSSPLGGVLLENCLGVDAASLPVLLPNYAPWHLSEDELPPKNDQETGKDWRFQEQLYWARYLEGEKQRQERLVEEQRLEAAKRTFSPLLKWTPVVFGDHHRDDNNALLQSAMQDCLSERTDLSESFTFGYPSGQGNFPESAEEEDEVIYSETNPVVTFRPVESIINDSTELIESSREDIPNDGAHPADDEDTALCKDDVNPQHNSFEMSYSPDRDPRFPMVDKTNSQHSKTNDSEIDGSGTTGLPSKLSVTPFLNDQGWVDEDVQDDGLSPSDQKLKGEFLVSPQESSTLFRNLNQDSVSEQIGDDETSEKSGGSPQSSVISEITFDSRFAEDEPYSSFRRTELGAAFPIIEEEEGQFEDDTEGKDCKSREKQAMNENKINQGASPKISNETFEGNVQGQRRMKSLLIYEAQGPNSSEVTLQKEETQKSNTVNKDITNPLENCSNNQSTL